MPEENAQTGGRVAAPLRRSDGTSGGSVVLSSRVFGAKVTINLMHRAVLAEGVNSRQDTRNTKTRGAVAGGGKKPYRQKGTGRARQGSISAPHYRHGGIVFGPHPRDLSARLTKKARRAALASALTAKAMGEEITILETLAFESISTKTAAALLASLDIEGKALIVLPKHDVVVYKSFRNIPGIQVRVAPAFSVRDVIDAGRVVIVADALETLDAAWGDYGQPDQADEEVVAE
ncbi:MAG: 50S ribosomal protein L4 [Capsulimonadaceae bacterium]